MSQMYFMSFDIGAGSAGEPGGAGRGDLPALPARAQPQPRYQRIRFISSMLTVSLLR
jgi:hypothetical protein